MLGRKRVFSRTIDEEELRKRKRTFFDLTWSVEGNHFVDVNLRFGKYMGMSLKEICARDREYVVLLCTRTGLLDPITLELAKHFLFADTDWEKRDFLVTCPGPFEGKRVTQIRKLANGIEYLWRLYLTCQYLSDQQKRILAYHLQVPIDIPIDHVHLLNENEKTQELFEQLNFDPSHQPSGMELADVEME